MELKVVNKVFSLSLSLSLSVSLCLSLSLYIYLYMVFTAEGLFEVAIESWPEWEFRSDALTD